MALLWAILLNKQTEEGNLREREANESENSFVLEVC